MIRDMKSINSIKSLKEGEPVKEMDNYQLF